MAKITNAGKTPRAFYIASKSVYAELADGESIDVTDADLAALKAPAFDAVVASGALVIDGADLAPAPAPTKTKAPKSTDGGAS